VRHHAAGGVAHRLQILVKAAVARGDLLVELLDVEYRQRVLEAAEELGPEGARRVVHLRLPRGEVDDLLVLLGRCEGELPRDVHATPLHVERDQLHGADVLPVAHGLLEVGELGEGRLLAPQAEPLHVRHVRERRRAGG